MRFINAIVIVIILFYSISTFAEARDVYAFTNSQQTRQFNTLLDQFRCLVCQNETLAMSNAPLAVTLRQQVYERVRAQQSDEAIKHYLIERYGDFISYYPPLQSNTLLLWLSPFLLLSVAFLALLRRVTRKRKQA